MAATIDRVQQTKRVSSDGTATASTTEIVDKDEHTAPTEVTASRIVWYIAGLIAIVLAFRFVFVLLGASSANGFANFIYSVSHPLASPFFGLFNYKQQYGEARFEFSTLIAIIVYLLIGYGIAKLLTIRRPQ